MVIRSCSLAFLPWGSGLRAFCSGQRRAVQHSRAECYWDLSPTIAVMVACWTMKPLACLALFLCAPLGLAQSNQRRAPHPKFSELSPDDAKRLDQQRDLVASAIKQRYRAALTKT